MASRKKEKQYATATFMVVLLYFGILLGHNLILDPWQFFHQPWFRETTFIKNARFQNAGLINSYKFDSIILGTSMAENFSSKQASKLWGSHFINLSISAGLHSERALILQRALKKKEIRHIIYSLDFYPHAGVDSFKKDYPVEQFNFLYNQNPFDDLSLYLDWELFSCWDLKTDCKERLPGERRSSLEGLYEWSSIPQFQRRFGGFDNWLANREDKQVKDAFKEIRYAATRIEKKKIPHYSLKKKTAYRDNLENSIITYVAQMAEAHPETQFHLIFPPYSTTLLAIWLQSKPDLFDLYTHYIHFVTLTIASHDNISVYGFNDMSFTDNIANYKDLWHYSEQFNRKMLEWIHQGQHELTMDNIDTYLATINRKAHGYDLLGLDKLIREKTKARD